jgi:hypothetical protein
MSPLEVQPGRHAPAIPHQRDPEPRRPSASEARTGRIMGLWFLATFVFSIPAVLLYDPLLHDVRYVLGSGHDTRIALGAVSEVLSSIAGIATAVVIFPIVKRVSESIALGYVATRILESTVIVMGLVSLMSVVGLREALAGTGRADAALVTVGQALVEVHDQTFLLGPQFCAGVGNGILLGYLMWRSGLVPRGMAMIGLVGGPLAFVGGVGVLLGAWDDPSTMLFLFTALEIVWEFSLGVYLTVWGFRPSAILTGPPAAAPRTPTGAAVG